MTHSSSRAPIVWANLLLAPLMWILSSVNFVVPSARSAKDFSDMSDNLLVPFGAAFSIWLPIFVGCIAYGIVQWRASNRARDVFRSSSGWTAAGFAGVCGWALISAFVPDSLVQWGTALIFVPTMLCLVKAMTVIHARKTELTGAERIMVHLPISLIAGWTSIAVFLNWMPIAADALSGGLSLQTASLIVLAFALIWALFVLRRKARNLAYAFPIIWGLAFLAVRHIGQEDGTTLIGGAAIFGAAVIALAAVKRNARASA